MERRKICASFDDHDYDQLVLLATINRMKLSDLLRKIIRAHLDGRRLELQEQRT
jgi:hypothetical protein